MPESWEWAWATAAVVLIGLVTLFVIVGAYTVYEEVTVEVVTPTTAIVDELIPAISITAPPAPPPTLSQRAETYVVKTREERSGDWVDSLSSVDLVIYIRDVCAEFDRGLWFGDMFERRLDVIVNQGWTSEADAVDLQFVMADGVLTFCDNHMNRLPDPFLLDDR